MSIRLPLSAVVLLSAASAFAGTIRPVTFAPGIQPIGAAARLSPAPLVLLAPQLALAPAMLLPAAPALTALEAPIARVVGQASGWSIPFVGAAVSLKDAERLSNTVAGARQVWDLAAPAGSLTLAEAVAEPAAEPAAEPPPGARLWPRLLPTQWRTTTASHREERGALAVERTGRWGRMKAATKGDFVLLKAGVVLLKNSLVLPRSLADVAANAKAFGRFLSEVKRLGWRVMTAVVLYYLIRDSILYLLLPYLILHGFFN